ncbi:metallopeptidase [Sphaerisporangium melleum]|uniref:Aminopeptidase N n=1 Tax=Sphaerisporangium melleum TaxID=321316 RepID=A0A917QTJ1_9ACTN|nr:M1 family metallopeptidase [Sphaerisporangium melleum]GGK67887.1 metallopeptidase [Sphaerisporangium melleum]GII68424.1 metallopeptidase [Sphaerisporangium melleum]
MSSRRTRGAAAVAALCTLASLQLAPPAYAAPGAPGHPRYSAGAPGLGDPYFPDQGNGGYDVRHYDIAFRYDPATRRMDATSTITAVATQDLDRFDLDFRGPDISSLKVGEHPASFTRTGQELVVTPRPKLKTGDTFTVQVAYAGTPPVITDPDGSIEGWVPTDDGAFVPGEPQGAPSWFPANDHPTDKATFTFHATVPEGITAVGNGRLVSQKTSGGWTTFLWDSSEPMATYLATVTLGNFTVDRSTTPSGIPVYTAVDPRLVTQSAAAVAKIPDIVEYFSTIFGPYPFGSTGAIIDRAPDVGYALESQTKPIFSSAPGVGTMAHELAHQWYGDSVSLTKWSDIWLNEGFATYASWLWTEHSGGTTAQATFNSGSNYGRAATSSFWQTVTTDPGPVDMFGNVPYNRGAMTLHALRGKIGDAAFFRLVKEWATDHRYGNTDTAAFITHAERVSGMNLTSFFNTWLHQKGKPTTW